MSALLELLPFPTWSVLVVGFLLVCVVLVGVVWAAILRNLPRELVTRDADENEVPPALDALVAEYEACGFERIGPPLRLQLDHSPFLLALYHPDESAFATVFRIPSTPPRTGCDVVTVCRKDGCALTTCMDHAAGVLEADPGTFRQIFPGASVKDLVSRHREGVGFLRGNDLPPRMAEPSEFLKLFGRSFSIQRRAFRRAPLKNCLLALWRTVTRRNPYLGPLSGQPGIRAQIDAVRDGGGAWPSVREREEELLRT